MPVAISFDLELEEEARYDVIERCTGTLFRSRGFMRIPRRVDRQWILLSLRANNDDDRLHNLFQCVVHTALTSDNQ